MTMEDTSFIKYHIDESLSGERLDKGLSLLIDYVSRSSLQKKIKGGEICVNGIQMTKASTILKEGDEILLQVSPLKEIEILPEDISLDILYEDADVLVVNKPKGMVVHPSAGHYTGTLVNAILYHCKDSLSGINGILRPGIVHRIDKDTTGSLVVCKNDKAHQCIAEQLKEHSVNRIYYAICIGTPKEMQGRIETYLARDTRDRMKMAVSSSGKLAITNYKVIEAFRGYSLVECKLETGRTHQIRVHMASIGHPLLGDTIYGPSKCSYSLEGQSLHAKTLGFIHPTSGEYMEFDAPYPEYFTKLLTQLRAK